MAKLAFTIDADYQKVIKLREEIDRLKSTLSGMDGNTSPATLRAMETQLAQNTKEFDRLITSAVKAGHELETNLKKKIFEASQSVNTFSDKIIDQRVVVREVEADVKNLASAYAKLSKLDPNRGKLLSELNAARASLNEEKATLFGLQQEQSKARLSVKRLRDEYALYNNEGKSVQLTNGGMSVSFGKILGVIGGVGVLKELASEITTVTGQFQRFENVLTNALGGDNNKAKAYLGDIADFAAKTNFQLDELTDNFLKFVNRGVTPTMDSMTKLGDFTNSVSKPYAQLSEAILDINNPERWKEFGVQVQTNGSKVNLTFRGMTVEADRTVQSVMNAIEQFGSMDGIKGSTEAIAGTIEGQMSNLQDTIATVLNEIGQANSDIISGGISMTSTLIENYDKVGRALVGLIGTYGVYRTAVMLVTVAESRHTLVQIAHINVLALVRRGHQLLNATMLSNPYVAVTTLVVGLVSAMWALSNRTKDLSENQKKLSDASKDFQSEITKETRIAGELFSQLKKAKEGTTEYTNAKQKILKDYGKYLSGMNTEIATLKDQEGAYNAVTEAIKRNVAEKMKEKFINEGVGDSSAKQAEALKVIRERIYKDVGEDAGKTIFENVKEALSNKDLNYQSLVKQMKQSGVKNDAFGYGKVISDAIANFRKAEQDIKQTFKDAEDLFAQKDNKSAELIPSSVSEEIKTVTTNITTLKKQIEDLRSGKTKAEVGKTVQQTIEEKTKELKAAEDALATLTGKDKSSLKEASDQLKLQQNLSRSILDSELKLQAGRIAAMEDGKAKRMALAKQEYDEARTQIDKDEQDLLSKKGITKDQKKIVSDNANSLRLQEQQNLLKKNTDIEKSSAKEIQSIWADVNSRFSSGLENRLTEIDKFYEEAIKKAREEGVEEIKIAELISKAKEEKASVKNESFIEKGMQRIAMEEEVAQKHLEIKQDQFVTDSVYQLKRNSLERKFTLDRLNLLKRSIAQEGTERYRQIEDEKKQLSGHLAYLDEYGETLKGEIIQDALSGLSDIAGAIGGLNDDLGETMNNLQQMIGAMAQLASGNYIGAAISAITSVVSSIAKSNQEAIQRAKETEGHYWDAVNWKIERQIELMKELQGISSDQVNQSIQTQIDELMDILYNADFKYKGKSGAEMQWMVENLLGGYKKAVASGNKLAQKVLEGMANGLEGNLFGDKKFDDVLKGLTTEELISLQGIPDVWKVLPEEVQQYIKQLSDAVDKQKELTDTTNEMFTGTAENEIANSILDALSKGKDGVDDFSTYFKDMMKNAMLQGVNMKYLQEPIKKFYEQFSAMSQSDEKLTKTEIDELREMYQQIVDNAQAQFENLKDISGLDFSTPEEGESDNTLKGAYAKASQESIDLLAGQTGASRVVLEDIRNNMQPIREQMKLIHDLQVRGWEDVKAIRDLSDKVEKNTNRIAENTQEIKTVADKISDNTKRTVETLEGTIDVKVKM